MRNAVQKKAASAPRKITKFRGIRNPRKGHRVWFGTFPTAEKAARAYDEIAIRIHGKTTKLNFPDNPAPPVISTSRPVTHKNNSPEVFYVEEKVFPMGDLNSSYPSDQFTNSYAFWGNNDLWKFNELMPVVLGTGIKGC